MLKVREVEGPPVGPRCLVGIYRIGANPEGKEPRPRSGFYARDPQLAQRPANSTHPAGGHLLWVELPAAIGTVELFEKALKNGVCFGPGTMFSSTGRYRNCLRLQVALPWSERVEKAVETLGKLASRELRASIVATEGARRRPQR